VAPAGASGLAAAHPCSLPEEILPTQQVWPHVQPTLVGPGMVRDWLWLAEQQLSPDAGARSFATMHHVASSVASRENKGIGVVVDLQNFSITNCDNDTIFRSYNKCCNRP
jgi:hypothetical protein